MTKKQRAEAVTNFLSTRLKEAANDFHKKEYEDEDKKSEDLAKVIVIRAGYLGTRVRQMEIRGMLLYRKVYSTAGRHNSITKFTYFKVVLLFKK